MSKHDDPRMNSAQSLAAEHHHVKAIHALRWRNKQKGKRRLSAKPCPSERQAICRNRKWVFAALRVAGYL